MKMMMKVVGIVVAMATLAMTPGTGEGLGAAKCEQWRPHAMYVGWRGQELETILRVMWRETGGTCKADVHNGEGMDDSYGLTQINTKGYLWSGHKGVRQVCGRFVKAKKDLFNPLVNLWCARELWKVYGGRALWRVKF